MQILILFLVAGILYLLQAHYFSKHWTDNLHANISFSKTHAKVGDTVALYEEITNHKSLPLPVLHVKFKTSRSFRYQTTENSAYSDHFYRNDVFSILGNQQIKRTLKFETTKRGYYTLDSINLVAKDLFLSHSEGYNLDNHSFLYVFPQPLIGHESLQLTNQLIGDILTKNYQSDPLSFRSIRDYTRNDEMRYINWKSSAKQQQLMVNTYYDTQTTAIVLLVNFDTNSMIRPDWMREYIASVATTIIQIMGNQNFSIQIITNATDSITKHPYQSDAGCGPSHLRTLYEGLATLDLEDDITDFLELFSPSNDIFQDTHKNVSYVVLSNYRKEDLVTAYNQKCREGYSMYFVCPEHPEHIKEKDLEVVHKAYYWRVHANEA